MRTSSTTLGPCSASIVVIFSLVTATIPSAFSLCDPAQKALTGQWYRSAVKAGLSRAMLQEITTPFHNRKQPSRSWYWQCEDTCVYHGATHDDWCDTERFVCSGNDIKPRQGAVPLVSSGHSWEQMHEVAVAVHAGGCHPDCPVTCVHTGAHAPPMPPSPLMPPPDLTSPPEVIDQDDQQDGLTGETPEAEVNIKGLLASMLSYPVGSPLPASSAGIVEGADGDLVASSPAALIAQPQELSLAPAPAPLQSGAPLPGMLTLQDFEAELPLASIAPEAGATVSTQAMAPVGIPVNSEAAAATLPSAPVALLPAPSTHMSASELSPSAAPSLAPEAAVAAAVTPSVAEAVGGMQAPSPAVSLAATPVSAPRAAPGSSAASAAGVEKVSESRAEALKAGPSQSNPSTPEATATAAGSTASQPPNARKRQGDLGSPQSPGDESRARSRGGYKRRSARRGRSRTRTITRGTGAERE